MNQSNGGSENQTEEITFMGAAVEGLQDVEKGRTLSLAEIRAELHLK